MSSAADPLSRAFEVLGQAAEAEEGRQYATATALYNQGVAHLAQALGGGAALDERSRQLLGAKCAEYRERASRTAALAAQTPPVVLCCCCDGGAVGSR